MHHHFLAAAACVVLFKDIVQKKKKSDLKKLEVLSWINKTNFGVTKSDCRRTSCMSGLDPASCSLLRVPPATPPATIRTQLAFWRVQIHRLLFVNHLLERTDTFHLTVQQNESGSSLVF